MERDQNVKTEFENTRRGTMVATSTGGTVTGKGGDILIGDDVLNPELAESEAERNRALEFIDETWSSRLDDKRTGRMVFVEQRLHAKDVTAHLMKQGVWTQLVMPAIFDQDTEYVMPMTGRKVAFKAGDLLSTRDTPETLEQTKLQMGTRGFQAQFLQKPSLEEGAIIKRSWFKTYKREALPKMQFTVWSWDTAAKDGQQNDYSVGQLWGMAEGCFYLLDMVRLRLNYPALRREARERWIAQRSDVVLVEDTSVGQALTPDLKADRVPVIPVSVERDKVVRLNVQSPVIEAGMVHIPDAADAPWVVQFRDEICDFPYSDHDDAVDSATQALHYLRTKNSIPAWRPI
jgi:predicted phage terminase large subunit-like protein